MAVAIPALAPGARVRDTLLVFDRSDRKTKRGAVRRADAR
jgi:hypothetical protein